jgi:hypothetical protein
VAINDRLKEVVAQEQILRDEIEEIVKGLGD